jgi:hypothetical protein
MNNFIVAQILIQHQSNLDNLLSQLYNFATDINNQQLQLTISNLRQNIN